MNRNGEAIGVATARPFGLAKATTSQLVQGEH